MQEVERRQSEAQSCAWVGRGARARNQLGSRSSLEPELGLGVDGIPKGLALEKLLSRA